LREFAAWFSDAGGRETAPGLVTTIDLKEYQAYLITIKRRKPATVNRKMMAVKKWLACSGCHVRLPKAVREQRKQPKALERSEQNALLRAVERSAGARNIALVRIMLSCGLRVGEAVRLKTSDVTIGERRGVITVRSGKGSKYREVPVPAETRRALKEHMTGVKEEWLFPGRSGGHLTPRAAQMLVAGYGYRARVDVSPHILRHTCATNLLRAGTDIRLVAAVLGHENINTTAVYTVPGERDLAKALEGAEV